MTCPSKIMEFSKPVTRGEERDCRRIIADPACL
ncbi:hypothetical protein FHS38_007077 [Streptomyces netropsis]|uniref:Uncharacterized protein n=1 Tax=Streptomyces netropsis TaxID=55404 RepID=A0A7W7LJS3_STRNE|nr:hypothetical protein [Streptomyces netropsis]